MLLFSIEGLAEVSARLSYRQMKTSCTPVDLRPALGPIRNQGELGWCYANAAADLLSFEYARELKGKTVSSSYVALANSYNIGASADHMSGWINQALLNSEALGLCPISLDREIFYRDNYMKLSTIQELIDLKVRFDQTQGQSLTNDHAQIRESADNPLSRLRQVELFGILKNSTVESFPFLLARGLCREQFLPVQRKVSVRVLDRAAWHLWAAPLLFKIHQVLDQKQIIGINYSMALFDQDHAPVDMKNAHASVIVGRRWNDETQACELQIRNSWGTTCSNLNYKGDFFRKPGVCEAGNVWVSEEKIEDYAFSVTYFDHLKGWFK